MTSITVTPHLVAELLVEGERMPVVVHVIDHPGGRVLVDSGLIERHPAVDDMDPIVHPEVLRRLVPTVDAMVNTHLHFDHCGGNRLLAGVPIHVQRRELAAASSEGYTLEEWVDREHLDYVQHDGDFELLPGVRVLAAPGHTDGSQIVAIDTDDGLVIIAGDTAVWSGELDNPSTEGQRRIVDLSPAAVWLSHALEPWPPAS